MGEEQFELRAIRMPDNFEQVQSVDIINQLLLPHEIRYESVSTVGQAWDAIKTMKIRGAPAIASLAALGIACELVRIKDQNLSTSELRQKVEGYTKYLMTSRPTAVNLREAMDRINAAAQDTSCTSQTYADRIIQVALGVWSADVQRNYDMGKHGANWLIEKAEAEGAIPKGGKLTVLTVCNTGSLATSAYGTAIGMITTLFSMGRLEHAFFAQTAPYQQGARLTSLELQSLKIPCTMVPDTAIAALLQGKSGRSVHAFIAGADRIASNGDTANKISTFQISTLCKAIPNTFQPRVIVCAPLTTLDLRMKTGDEIVIEERPEIEACTVSGRKWSAQDTETDVKASEAISVLFTPFGTRAWNPAFDVTPARLIDAIVTEIGVASKPAGKDEYDLLSFASQS